MVVLLIGFIWLAFSLLYFSREISCFLTRKRKKVPAPANTVPHDQATASVTIFGGSKTNPANFFTAKDENNKNNILESNDNSKNVATFAGGENEGEAVEEEEEEEEGDWEDLERMFNCEYGENEAKVYDSDDAVSEEENVGASKIKTFGELQEDALNLLRVYVGDENVGVAEKLRAKETLNELRGTDLFSQIENAAGASRAELMRQELARLWDEEGTGNREQEPTLF
jgi:phage host-nuclease inhibitor protein Gam